MSTAVSSQPITLEPGSKVAVLSMLRLYGVTRTLRQACADAAATENGQPGDLLDLSGKTYRTVRTLAIRTLDSATAWEFRRLFPARFAPDTSESRVLRQIDLLLAWLFEHAAQSAAVALENQMLVYPTEVLSRDNPTLADGRGSDQGMPQARLIPLSREAFERLAAASAVQRPELEPGDTSASALQSTGQYL